MRVRDCPRSRDDRTAPLAGFAVQISLTPHRSNAPRTRESTDAIPHCMPVTFFPTSSAVKTTRRTLRVLYADDMEELRNIIEIYFRRDGHAIECVADGNIALERVTADPHFDLVITDHHMPVMKGLELVRGLREIGFAGRTMVFSSELSPAVLAEYQQLHVDRILMKPIYPSELRVVINELFPAKK